MSDRACPVITAVSLSLFVTGLKHLDKKTCMKFELTITFHVLNADELALAFEHLHTEKLTDGAIGLGKVNELNVLTMKEATSVESFLLSIPELISPYVRALPNATFSFFTVARIDEKLAYQIH